MLMVKGREYGLVSLKDGRQLWLPGHWIRAWEGAENKDRCVMLSWCPLAQIRHSSIGQCTIISMKWRHWSSPLKIWVQVKSLAAQGQIIVQHSIRLVMDEHLFLVICALLSVSSVERSAVSYWAYYVHNPTVSETVF